MAKPKWLMKPLDIYETEFGFSGSGEGMIYEYEKSSHKYGEPMIYYFVLTNNRMNGSLYLMFRSRSMGMQSIRRNIEVRQDFSKYFKRNIFSLLFKDKNIKSIERVVDILERVV